MLHPNLILTLTSITKKKKHLVCASFYFKKICNFIKKHTFQLNVPSRSKLSDIPILMNTLTCIFRINLFTQVDPSHLLNKYCVLCNVMCVCPLFVSVQELFYLPNSTACVKHIRSTNPHIVCSTAFKTKTQRAW